MTIVFSKTTFSSWQVATATSVVCKMEVSTERRVVSVAWLTIINKDGFLIPIYKVLLGTAFRIGLTDFLSMICHATVSGIVITVKYVGIYIDVHWW